MDLQVGQTLCVLSFCLWYTLCPFISIRQEKFWFKILWLCGWPYSSTGGGGGMYNLWIWYQQILPPDSRIFQLMSPCGFLGCSWFPGIWDFLVATQRTHPWLLYTSVQFPDLCTHLPFSTIPDSSPIFPLPLFSSSKGEFISGMQAYFNICSSIKCNKRQNIELHCFPKAFRNGS